jgi:dihydropyrimidinase
VIDFILQTQGKSLQSALNDWKGRSDNNAVGDYSFHMAVTDFNDETKKEMQSATNKETFQSKNIEIV